MTRDLSYSAVPNNLPPVCRLWQGFVITVSAAGAENRKRLIPLAPVLQNAVTRAIPDVRTNSELTAFPEVRVMADFPTSLLDFQRRFADDAACATWLGKAC